MLFAFSILLLVIHGSATIYQIPISSTSLNEESRLMLDDGARNALDMAMSQMNCLFEEVSTSSANEESLVPFTLREPCFLETIIRASQVLAESVALKLTEKLCADLLEAFEYIWTNADQSSESKLYQKTVLNFIEHRYEFYKWRDPAFASSIFFDGERLHILWYQFAINILELWDKQGDLSIDELIDCLELSLDKWWPLYHENNNPDIQARFWILEWLQHTLREERLGNKSRHIRKSMIREGLCMLRGIQNFFYGYFDRDVWSNERRNKHPDRQKYIYKDFDRACAQFSRKSLCLKVKKRNPLLSKLRRTFSLKECLGQDDSYADLQLKNGRLSSKSTLAHTSESRSFERLTVLPVELSMRKTSQESISPSDCSQSVTPEAYNDLASPERPNSTQFCEKLHTLHLQPKFNCHRYEVARQDVCPITNTHQPTESIPIAGLSRAP